MAASVYLHVFGGSIGECIVLGLPGNRWALIDVYLDDSGSPNTSPIIKFLQEQGVKELEFLCLTHPHFDHVRGVGFLMRNYRIKRFLGFGSSTPEESYNQIVKVLKVKAKRLNDNAREEELASELLDFLAKVRAKVKNKEMVLDPVVVNYLALDEVVGAEKTRLRILAIAPSGRSIDTYHGYIKACFDQSAQGKILADNVDRVPHNEISSAFILEYGTQRVILGGDLETEGWEDILARRPGFELCADLVKVSHHGSKSGYCPRLWEDHLSPKSCATAVVTAFAPHGLPKPEGIAHLKENSKRLVTTSLSSLRPKRVPQSDPSAFVGLALDAQLALGTVFKNVLTGSRPSGVCSFSLDGSAQLAERLSGNAGVIS